MDHKLYNKQDDGAPNRGEMEEYGSRVLYMAFTYGSHISQRKKKFAITIKKSKIFVVGLSTITSDLLLVCSCMSYTIVCGSYIRGMVV